MTETIQQAPVVQEMHRNDLRPEVRRYADNLQRQLTDRFANTGVSSPTEFIAQARSKQISPLELKETVDIMRTLRETIQKGEIPFDETTFHESIDRLIGVFDNEDLLREFPYIEADVDYYVTFYQMVIDRCGVEIPKIPREYLTKEFFINDLYQKIYSRFNELHARTRQDAVGEKFGRESGFLFSSILNKSLEDFVDVPEDQQPHIVVDLDSKQASLVGYALPAGHLRVGKADQAKYVGMRMTGGVIDATICGGFLGREMTGGRINVVSARDYVGNKMQDGEIQLREAEQYLGSEMSGGKIICKHATDVAGYRMTGGEIQLNNALSALGRQMTGGAITAIRATENVGFQMAGGMIEITEQAGNSLGTDMRGGTIIAKYASKGVGMRMVDGHIKVENTTEGAGSDMIGGKLEIGEARGTVGKQMTGGEIIVKDAGPFLGFAMRGGKITAENAGMRVGGRMSGGEIYITGGYQNLETKEVWSQDARTAGDIYYKGELIS